MLSLQFQEDFLQAVVALDLFHGAGTDQLAALDDGHLIAQLLRHLQHLGGEEDRAAPVAQLPHHALEQMGGLGVQSHEGFVHEDQLWLVDPRGDDRQLLLHAMGIGGDGLGQIARQFKEIGIFTDTQLPFSGTDTKNICDEVQIFDAFI